ncbi:hypothetical protein ABTM28_20540, partial [Acinetobacter baumannii]
MSPASPGAPALEQDTVPSAGSLRQTLRKLWQTAAVWTLAVVGVTAWWTQQDIARHRQDVLKAAEYRLDSLHGAVDLSFQ